MDEQISSIVSVTLSRELSESDILRSVRSRVNLSTQPNNRVTKFGDGLHVLDDIDRLVADPLAYYILSRS